MSNDNEDVIHNNRQDLLSQVTGNTPEIPDTPPIPELPATQEKTEVSNTGSNEHDEVPNPDQDNQPKLRPLPTGKRWELKGSMALDDQPFIPPKEIKDIDKYTEEDFYHHIGLPAYVCSTEQDLEDINMAAEMNRLIEDPAPSIPRTLYLSALKDASSNMLPGDGLLPAICRPDAVWRQYIPIPNTKSRISPRFNSNIRKSMTGGEILIGNRAAELFLARNREFRPVQIPLYNTGIWIKMAPPSISYLTEIDRALALLKAEIGINTNGMVNSNEDVRFNEILIDAALKLITESNYPVKSPLQLKNIISQNDIDTLIWGMAVGAYGKGYDVNVPCTNVTCGFVAEFRAAPNRMRVVDNSRFTPWQIEHMGKGITNNVTDKDLERYQKEFNITARDSSKFVYKQPFDDGVGDVFNFRISTIGEYLEFANIWFGKIDLALQESMGNAFSNPEERINALDNVLDVEDLCRYGHLIESIEIANGTELLEAGIIRDPDTIRNILKLMAADPTGAEQLRKAISDFIQDTVTVIYGFENVPCPKCGEHRIYNDKTPMVIPFRVNVGFFTLYQHRLRLAGIEPIADLMMLGRVNSAQPTSAQEFMSSLEDMD